MRTVLFCVSAGISAVTFGSGASGATRIAGVALRPGSACADASLAGCAVGGLVCWQAARAALANIVTRCLDST
jgi:hypothetical protein